MGCGEGFLGIWCECSIPSQVRRGGGFGGDRAVLELGSQTHSSWRWRVKVGSQSCVPKGCCGLDGPCLLLHEVDTAVSRFKDPWHGWQKVCALWHCREETPALEFTAGLAVAAF